MGKLCQKWGPHRKNWPFFLILRKFDLNYQSSRLCLWVGIFYILNKNAKSIIDKGSQCKLGQSATEHCSKWGPHRKNWPILVTSFHSFIHKSSVFQRNFFKFRIKTRKVPQKVQVNVKVRKNWWKCVKNGGPTVKIGHFWAFFRNDPTSKFCHCPEIHQNLNVNQKSILNKENG